MNDMLDTMLKIAGLDVALVVSQKDVTLTDSCF